MVPSVSNFIFPRGRTPAQNLEAQLTAAGLDDPDILALAAEVDALKQGKFSLKTSRAGGDESSCDGSPDSPLIGTMPASPVKSPTGEYTRSGSLSPPPGRRPAAVSTYAASSAARKNSAEAPTINNSTQPLTGSYAAAAASRAASPNSRGAPAMAATLFRTSSLGSQQQQQPPPHAVAFGATVPVSSVPNPPTRKISGAGAISPTQLMRKSSLGKEPTHSVAFGSTIPRNGAVSPTRDTVTCSITRRSSLPTGASLSRQNSSSNVHNVNGLTRRSSLGAEAVVVNGRGEGKNSIGGGRQPACASPARTGRSPGPASVYSGAAQAAAGSQAVTSPFAVASIRPVESPTPKIVHSTFNIESSIAKFNSLGQKTSGDTADAAAFHVAAAAAVAAEAAAGSSKHRRVPSLPVWPPEEAVGCDRVADDVKEAPAAGAMLRHDGPSIAAVKIVCSPQPAMLPTEITPEITDHTTENNFVTYNTGKKLPMLKEELSINTLNSSGGSGAIGALTNFFTAGGAKKGQQQQIPKGTPRGGDAAEKSFGDGGVTKSQEGITIHTTAGGRRSSGSSTASSDQDFNNNSNSRRWKSRLLCLGLPLLLLVIVAAVVGGVYGSKRDSSKGVADVMSFQITLAAPAKTPEQGCAAWFGSEERVATYKQLFSEAYANALDLPATETTVNHITCGGSTVHTSDGVRYITAVTTAGSRSARLLLSETFPRAARSLKQLVPVSSSADASSWAEITTVFSVPAPSDLARRSQILETVASTSTGILAGPLSQFLGVQDLMVKSTDPVTASADSVRGGRTRPQTPTEHPEELTPESGVMSDDVPMIPSTDITVDEAQGVTESQDGPGVVEDTITVTVTAPAAAQPPTELELSTHPWNPIKRFEAYAEAPACLFSPTRFNTITDARGRLWSLMDGKECAFRPQTDNARIGRVPITWDTANVCIEPPTQSNFVLDAAGRMWGWQKDETCAFRARYPPAPGAVQAVLTAQPLEVPNRISVVWDNAPMCPFAPSNTNIVADTFGRLWSWNDGKSCAFRFAN